ncbi:MAG: hypothetical protein HAW66_05085, partial [Shewanella sp.]|nr:hypothetical protein [Shewanella sp.]
MNWKFVSTIFVLACSIGTSVYFYKHLEQALAENRIALEAFKSEVSISGKIIPKNAVAFFNLQKCPKGWMHFTQGEGRFPIATNYNRNNLSARRLNDVGGEESHKLTVKELPR